MLRCPEGQGPSTQPHCPGAPPLYLRGCPVQGYPPARHRAALIFIERAQQSSWLGFPKRGAPASHQHRLCCGEKANDPVKVIPLQASVRHASPVPGRAPAVPRGERSPLQTGSPRGPPRASLGVWVCGARRGAGRGSGCRDLACECGRREGVPSRCRAPCVATRPACECLLAGRPGPE